MTTAIDRELEAPVYEQVAAVVRARIRAGEYAAGRRIPSALALASELRVARATVDAALRLLAREGLTRTVQRRGTYVTGDPQPPPVAMTGPGLVTQLAVMALAAVAFLAPLAITGLWAADVEPPW